MRSVLASVFAVAFFFAEGQVANREFADGHLYVKLSRHAAAPVLAIRSRTLEPSAIECLEPLAGKFGITLVTRPFAQATDDIILPSIIRVHFKQVYKADELIAELEQSHDVEYAEKVPLARTHATPNDYATTPASVHLNQINAQNAWNVFNGNSNITVAIVDNGVMWTHADLVANTYTNTGEIPGNNTDDDANGFVDDVNGYDVADWDNDPQPASTIYNHGTMCAGIAGARTDNSTGIASIGWNIKIIPVKAQQNSGANGVVLYGYEGIVYATRAKARVISCSWGSSSPATSELAVVNYAWNRGCIIIAASGNSFGPGVNYPAMFPNVYAVAAVNASDVKIAMATYGPWVDVSAPGDNIYTTMPYTGSPGYGYGTGTSMAAPMVAGLAALMLSKSPQMTRQDVLNCISSTAVNIYTLSGNSTYSNQLGAGRIDAYAAMMCAASYSAIPPVANFTGFMRQTCPNTPVQFTDSSLYLPAAWSWTFQGGTPATSTLTNPVVQFSATGTFSVGLTVTNSNGSDTEIKTAYVTVSGPVNVPLVEGFEQSQFLPPGWTPKNIMNDSMYWQRLTGLGAYGTSSACVFFNNYDYSVEGERDEMLTPKYTFTNVASARLRFDVAYARYDSDYSDSLEVKISTNCGASWTSIYLKGGTGLSTKSDQQNFFMPTSSQWRTDSIDITAVAAGQGNVMFTFINRGHYGQPIYLDNINLFFPTPTLSVTHATAICEGDSVKFNNTTSGAALQNWSAASGNPSTTTGISPTFTFSSAGAHTVVLTATNGTSIKADTFAVNVFSVPQVSVTHPGDVCAGAVFTITAGGAAQYVWSNSMTAASFTEALQASSSYTVTGINGGICTNSVATTVSVTPVPQISVAGATICAGESATLTPAGAQNYTWTGYPPSAILTVTPSSTSVFTVAATENGCTGVATATVFVNDRPVTVTTSTPSACGMACKGIIYAQTAGGTPPYQYFLSPASGCSSPPCLNLCPGTYTLNTVDANNCWQSSTVSINTAAPPSLSINLIHTCAGCSTGSAGVTVTGGHPPYQFSWSNGSTQPGISNLAEGCYTVNVTDAATCTLSATACIEGLSSVGEEMPDKVKLYPNPASDELTLTTQRPCGVYIYNNLSQLLFTGRTQSFHTIYVGEWARGTYLVVIKDAQGTTYRKLLVN